MTYKHKKHIVYIDHTGNYRTLCNRKQYDEIIKVWVLNRTHLDEIQEMSENISELNICKDCFKKYLKNLSGEIQQY